MSANDKLLSLAELTPIEKENVFGLYAACVDGDIGPQWSKEGLSDILELAGAGALFLQTKENKLVGYIIWRSVGLEAELLNIGVLPEYRKKGCGAKLLSAMLASFNNENIEKTFLEVREGNKAAQKLYMAHGFGASGRRKNYYELLSGGREHALIMSKPLNPE